MGKKHVRQPMLPWVKRGGKLTKYSRGVVHGMHLSGMTVTWIAERMGMTPSGVRRSLSISQGIAEGTRGETIEKLPTTPSPKKEEIAERRAKVATMLRKRSRDGSPVHQGDAARAAAGRCWRSSVHAVQRFAGSGRKVPCPPKNCGHYPRSQGEALLARAGPALEGPHEDHLHG